MDSNFRQIGVVSSFINMRKSKRTHDSNVMDCSGGTSGDHSIINIPPEPRKFDVPIFRVPYEVRKHMPSAYDPTAISFGPYHHGKENLKAMDEVKIKYQSSFRKRNTKIELADYFEGVRTIKDKVKGCYYPDEDLSKMVDGQFVNMMTRDAIALVEMINRLTSDEERAKLGPDDWKEINAIRRDMMLLENQIPFIVLEKIWQVQRNPTSLVDQLLWFMRDIYSPKPEHGFSIEPKPLHLLHLLGLVAFPEDSSSSLQPPAADQNLIPPLSKLLGADVELKENEQARGLKVSFSNCVMTMNPLKITGDTENIFRNLTAFEQHYAGAALNASSYVALMNSLLRTSRDVEALCGILIRDPLTGLDVDVENLFKEVKLGVNVYTVDQGFSRAVLDWKREQEIYDSKIFRVPSHIRDLEPNAYEPTTISFGPYHHSEKRLQAMKRHK